MIFLRTNLTDQFQIRHVCQLWISTTLFILLHQINHAYTLIGPIFRKEFLKFICYYRTNYYRKYLFGYSRRQSIISRYTHDDDRRLNLFLRQANASARTNYK